MSDGARSLAREMTLEELRSLAVLVPEIWADLYDEEVVRRSPVYCEWLRDTGLLDTAASLHDFSCGHVERHRRSFWKRLRLWVSP